MKVYETMVNFYKIKDIVMINTSVQTFHDDHYDSAIYKISFHLLYVTIVGTNHCVKQRHIFLKEGTYLWMSRYRIIMLSTFLFSIVININMRNMGKIVHCRKKLLLWNALSSNQTRGPRNISDEHIFNHFYILLCMIILIRMVQLYLHTWKQQWNNFHIQTWLVLY